MSTSQLRLPSNNQLHEQVIMVMQTLAKTNCNTFRIAFNSACIWHAKIPVCLHAALRFTPNWAIRCRFFLMRSATKAHTSRFSNATAFITIFAVDWNGTGKLRRFHPAQCEDKLGH
jgi:hypothetical protein